MKRISVFFSLLLCCVAPSFARQVDLSGAAVVTRPGQLPNAEKTAAIVLTEELAKRSGIRLSLSTSWPKEKPAIRIRTTGFLAGHLVASNHRGRIPTTLREAPWVSSPRLPGTASVGPLLMQP